MSQPLAVRLRGLSFRYPDGIEALHEVALDLAPGEAVCLAGPNGAGKSTLLRCLAGLEAGAGEVLVGGAPLPAAGFGRVGLVFQDPDDQLFCGTVAEDVAFGPRNAGLDEASVRRRVCEALAAVGLAGQEGRRPQNLSGGERRRAAIASVLAMGVGVLALDEPWSGLDARGARALVDVLRALPATRLVASHDLARAAAVCARLVILDRGRVAADGPFEELLRDRGLLEAHGLEPRPPCASCAAAGGAVQRAATRSWKSAEE